MPEPPEKDRSATNSSQNKNICPSASSTAFLARASALLALATLLSRILGLARDMLIAHFYGAGGQTDNFAFAIVVPELLRTLIISGAVASVFIPLITEIQKSGKLDEVKRIAGMMISFIGIIALIVVVAGEAFAPQLVKASEFLKHSEGSLDPAKIALTTELVRILLPVVVLVGLWGLMGGILNTFDNFHVPGLAPLAWNGTIIIILISLGDREEIRHLAWAFVIGHAIQMLVHIPALLKLGIRPFAIDWKHPMLLMFLQLAPAAMLAYAAPAVNAFIGQGIALNLEEGSASSLMYAFRVQQLPMSVFGVSVAVAIFPTLSRYASSGAVRDIVATLASGLRMTALAVLPAVIFFLILPEQTIELIYQRGKFGSEDTTRVAAALFWYSWSILPMSLLLLTARTFFSEKDTRTPALLGVATIILYYILAVNLSGIYGFQGLPMSNSFVAWVFFGVSLFILHQRFKNRSEGVLLLSRIGGFPLVKMLIAGIIEAGVLLAFRHYFSDIHGTMPLIGMLSAAVIISAGVYLGVLWLLKSEDLSATINHLLRRG